MTYRIGDILYVSGLPIIPKKGKFCVLIAIGPKQFLTVNTENREIYDCIPLEKRGRDFPIYDSFIGCKNIFTASDEQIEKKVGMLEDDELRAIANKIESSRFISKIKKDLIIEAIKSELDVRLINN